MIVSQVMKNVLIRVDGNSKIGLGHIYRGIAIADILKNNFIITFVVGNDTNVSPIIDANFEVIYLPKNIIIDRESIWFSKNYSSKNVIILLDGYNFNVKYQLKLKSNRFILVYIDDLAKKEQCADLVINHSPSISANDYQCEKYTKLALGKKYAILRPLFLKEAKNKRIVNIDRKKSIFVCFGGADPYNLTKFFCDTLLKISNMYSIHLIIGGANKSTYQEFVGLENVFVYSNLSEENILLTMKKCDVAFVPSSSILLELISVKMLIFSGYYTKDQQIYFNSMIKENVFISMGNLKTIDENKIKKLINKINDRNYNELCMNQMNFLDGNSGKRILDKFLNL